MATLSSISQSGSTAPPLRACEASFDQILQLGPLRLSRTFFFSSIAAFGQRHNLRSSSSSTAEQQFPPRTGRERRVERKRDFLHPQHLSLPPAMERGVIFCPKWLCVLWFSLLMMLCWFHGVKAEITCRSCQPGNKWRARELLLRFDTSETATGSKREVFGHRDGAGRSGAASADSRRLRCAAGSAECASARVERGEPRLKRNTDNLRAKDEIVGGEVTKMKVSHVKMSGQQKTNRYRKRTRRNVGNNQVASSASAKSQAPGEDSNSAAGRRVARSELRWSGEERRAAGPRQEELKLNSSTFALTGDSSHNQAMVHWSGQNSSVSSHLLCPL